ncbi:MAG: hypothetical protein VX405_08350 [Myxococcota bacterium]|nr:hypothetical protein [Myxococcota bacterium]
MIRCLFFPIVLIACGGPSIGQIDALEGQFQNGRQPDFSGTVFAWRDATFFNAGYEQRPQAALEVLATRSRFNPQQDLLSFEGDDFLNLQKDFLFADAFRLRIGHADALSEGQKFQMDSEAPDPSFVFALKIGAEALDKETEADDPRDAFRLPGHLQAGLEVLQVSSSSVQLQLQVTSSRCENNDEGPAYIPGDFTVTLTAPLLDERLSEHNVKVLLGLSTVPLPDPNGFSFPGFTQNCSNNPRPLID